MISISSERNKKPDTKNSSLDKFVDEYIWGHRIYDEQTPEMIFLEFLCILQYHKDNPLETKTGGISYSLNINLRMRELIYKNPYLEIIDNNCTLNDDKKWQTWWEKFSSDTEYFDDGDKLKNLEKLKISFKNIDNTASFKYFANIISLLRAISFEINSAKRWTSNYIFPIGPKAVYADCDLHGRVDRRFFARTGELLYLMLCRTKNSSELGKKLVKIFLENNNPLNRFLDILQIEDDSNKYNASASMFLPDETSDLFENLAQDWMEIIKLQIPSNDQIYYLCQLSALYFIEYILIKSKLVLGEDTNIDIVCEVVSTQKNKIRKLSADRFIQNNTLTPKALKSFIETIKEDEQWIKNEAAYPDQPSHNISLMCQYFHVCEKERKEYEACDSADDALNLFHDSCQVRHKEHLYLVHQTFGKRIGLVSSVKTNRTRYILPDHLLKTLVYANVKKRMVVHEFLELLYKKYNIVLGQNEAQRYIKANLCDPADFQYNVEVLEKRLESLGLLFRLSDSYSYVLNPFYNVEKAR